MGRSLYLLWPLDVTYKLGAAFHRNLYELDILQQTRLEVPVIGVGNLSFGGSGKTMVVEAVARRLAEGGRKVGIVCRSYGAEDGPHILEGDADPYVVGDEAAMMVEGLGEVKVGEGKIGEGKTGKKGNDCGSIVVASGRDKTGAARALMERMPDLDVLVVDDAFQHHRLYQDVKVLIWPKPGALLRECRRAAARADVLLVPNGERSPRAESETVYFVKEILGIEESRSQNPEAGRNHIDTAHTILLAAGLGPEAGFFEQVRKYLGKETWEGKLGEFCLEKEHGGMNELRFPDHVDYRRADVQARLVAASGGCDAIVTTAKDAVKLRRLALALPPIYVVRAQVKFLTNEQMLWRAAEKCLHANIFNL